jgi:hypothetical protein
MALMQNCAWCIAAKLSHSLRQGEATTWRLWQYSAGRMQLFHKILRI